MDVPSSEVGGGPAPAPAPAASSTTRVSQLTVSQLQSILRARGVQLPAYTQSTSFYLDLCRKHGITEVPSSEVGGQAPAPAPAATGTTPVSRLSVAQLQSVLRARGVQLPGYTQTSSFYLDLCRGGITEVPSSEVGGQTPAPRLLLPLGALRWCAS